MDDKDPKPIFSISFTKGEPVATGLHCKGWLKLFSFNSNLCWDARGGDDGDDDVVIDDGDDDDALGGGYKA